MTLGFDIFSPLPGAVPVFELSLLPEEEPLPPPFPPEPPLLPEELDLYGVALIGILYQPFFNHF